MQKLGEVRKVVHVRSVMTGVGSPSGLRGSSAPAIHVSLALRGSSSHMHDVARQADQFLAPHTLVTHVSHGSAWGNATAIALGLRGRLLLNPLSLRVSKDTPQVLNVHMRNVQLLLESLSSSYGGPLSADDDKLVILAANQQLFRPCRHHVLRHTLSFSLGQTTDIWDDPGRGAATLAFGGADWRGLMARVPKQDDAFIQRNVWFRDRVDWMHGSERPPGWQSKPLSYMPHEGSFYPLGLLRKFLARIDGTALDTRRPCPYKGLHCFHEETLLPTFVWQDYAKDVLLAGPDARGTHGPPIVVRAWSQYNASVALRRLDLSDPQLRYVCGVKYAGRHAPVGMDAWLASHR